MEETLGAASRREADGRTCHGRLFIEDDGALGSYDIDDPHQLGKLGEEVATRYLEAMGLSVIERNWRCGYGEVDIVAQDDDETVLVEVKTRRSRRAFPELAVDAAKRERYRRLSLCYLMEHRCAHALRFDVIAVSVVDRGGARVHHLMGACSWDS